MPKAVRRPKPKLHADGYWHAWVTVGVKANGRADQRHIKRRTEDEVEDAIDELLALKAKNAVPKSGPKPKLAEWLTTYLDEVAPRRCGPDTIKLYRGHLRNHIGPLIGHIKVNEVRPENIDAVYVAMGKKGTGEGTQRVVHSFISRALEVAWRRDLCGSNVVRKVDAPVSDPVDIVPIDTADARLILDSVADGRRNAARWSVAMALGLRQGEALGLRWRFIDFETRQIHVWWKMNRRIFEHGCKPACGRKRACDCPDRVLPLRQGESQLYNGFVMGRPKGRSTRTIPLPEQLFDELKLHKERQDKERELAEAGGLWADLDLVFASEVGLPIDPSDDRKAWKAIVAAVGVDEARVHDMRHTAASLLIEQGVPTSVVQEILGHADVRTTQRYVHVGSESARRATDAIGSALLGRALHPFVHPRGVDG